MNLQETARSIVREHGGVVPRAVHVLRTLPGVGPYTAAAVASIAYGEPVAAVDTNVRRVVARGARAAEPDELDAAQIRADAESWLDRREPGLWNQAMMDLGRAVCRPTAPRCPECPIARWCSFAGLGRTGRRSAKPQARFEGSRRQVRGAVIRVLRSTTEASLRELTASIGFEEDRIRSAVEALLAEGLLERAGRSRVRLHVGAG